MKISFAEADVAIPPYTDVVSWADNQLTILLNMGNYLLLEEDELYIAAYLGPQDGPWSSPSSAC